MTEAETLARELRARMRARLVGNDAPRVRLAPGWSVTFSKSPAGTCSISAWWRLETVPSLPDAFAPLLELVAAIGAPTEALNTNLESWTSWSTIFWSWGEIPEPTAEVEAALGREPVDPVPPKLPELSPVPIERGSQ